MTKRQGVTDEQFCTLSEIIDEHGLTATLETIAAIADQNADECYGRAAKMWLHAGAMIATLVLIIEQWGTAF